MASNRTDSRKPLFVAWLAACCAAGALAAGIVGGLWLRPADGRAWQALLPAAVLALTALIGIAWQSRIRAARRLDAALSAYVEREIARVRRRNAPKRL